MPAWRNASGIVLTSLIISIKPGRRLGYKFVKKSGDLVNLLEKPGGKPWDMMTVPQSMREVEAGVRLIMNSEIRKPEEIEPDWEAAKKVFSADDSPSNSQPEEVN